MSKEEAHLSRVFGEMVSLPKQGLSLGKWVISEALGHSSVAFTMDVYSHIIKDMQNDAKELLDEVQPVFFKK